MEDTERLSVSSIKTWHLQLQPDPAAGSGVAPPLLRLPSTHDSSEVQQKVSVSTQPTPSRVCDGPSDGSAALTTRSTICWSNQAQHPRLMAGWKGLWQQLCQSEHLGRDCQTDFVPRAMPGVSQRLLIRPAFLGPSAVAGS